MTKKKEVVLNSVSEFLGIWALRGDASLSLETKDGVTTIAFSHSLSGHPEDPLRPPPVPSGHSHHRRRRRRRGPARRERDRQRAARHQAAQAGAPPASSPKAASPAAHSTPEHLRDSGTSALGHVEENEAPALVPCEHTYFNSFTGLLEPEPCPLHPCCAMCEITAASEESRPPRFCNFQADSFCPRPCSGAIFDVDISSVRGHGDWEVFNFIVGAPSLLEFRL